MEQNVMIINAQNGQIKRKEVKPWFNEQNIYINQGLPLSHQLSYNKYQNNIGLENFLDNTSTNIQWQKDTSIMGLIPIPVYQHDAIPSTNNSFRSNLPLNIELFKSL